MDRQQKIAEIVDDNLRYTRTHVALGALRTARYDFGMIEQQLQALQAERDALVAKLRDVRTLWDQLQATDPKPGARDRRGIEEVLSGMLASETWRQRT